MMRPAADRGPTFESIAETVQQSPDKNDSFFAFQLFKTLKTLHLSFKSSPHVLFSESNVTSFSHDL